MFELKLIDKLFPEHDRTSCSDENPCNGMALDPVEGLTLDHKCNRCSSLKALNELKEEE